VWEREGEREREREREPLLPVVCRLPPGLKFELDLTPSQDEVDKSVHVSVGPGGPLTGRAADRLIGLGEAVVKRNAKPRCVWRRRKDTAAVTSKQRPRTPCYIGVTKRCK
jgi:hypothetical protein